ncbi:MAG TPA: NAD-dependent deacylase [Thermosulfidibacter takaii]|uniref:NAD-dependent protein deacylase n=1 Tax=Thermosulfidibacter takaii TaxID=412593 RepID=A0A7C0Y7R6_9BACT|nr:NAD-dependent deacylase [Thermosulfidibacter takaii]
MNEKRLRKAAQLLRMAQHVIALTGAGISVDSGIPAFRGAQGLWDRYDPAEYAHISSFTANPGKVWGMLKELHQIMEKAQPNPAHYALARLEELGILKALVTQNVDGLHQKAGSRRVIEFHGNGETLICLSCGKEYPVKEMALETLPPLCPSCQGVLKPQVVFFGEPIPPQALEEAFREADECDVMLVVGTSAQVYPAADLPRRVAWSRGSIIEVNLEETHLTQDMTHIFLQGSAASILPRLVELVEEN